MAGSKRFRFEDPAPVNRGIAETLRAGSEQSAELNTEFLDLESIEPDPDNPRKLAVTKEEVGRWSAMWQEDWRTISEDGSVPGHIEKLLGMADTISQVGVQQPIKVYRHGDGFRILLGERRYWAAKIAGQMTIPAWIVHRPPMVRAIQFIENFQRDDLTLGEKIQNIRGLSDELAQVGSSRMTSAALAQAIGVSNRQARKYLAAMTGPVDLQSAIDTGMVNSLDIAAEIASIKDPSERARAIAASAEGEWGAYQKARNGSSLHTESVEPRAQRRAGRRAARVSLGTTKNMELMREVFRRIGGQAACSDVDWGDYNSINQAWKELLRSLESEL